MATLTSDERTSRLQRGPVAWFDNQMDADVIVVGAGLAGLVATAELARAGRRVLLVDQEHEANLGGQAFWSFGGLFLVDSPEQRRLGIKDSARTGLAGLAGQRRGSTRLDATRTPGRVQWARAYVEFAAGEKRSWLHGRAALVPAGRLGRARRLRCADGHGNSVPRFHVTWGTGPGVVEPFVRRVREAAATRPGRVPLPAPGRRAGRHRRRGRPACAARCSRPATRRARPRSSTGTQVGEFELHAQAVIVTTGGIGANHDLVRANWPARLGTPPERMITGVPAYVDGRMLDIAERRRRRALVNRDRMWHYTEGIQNWDPIWPGHGIRILPGPSSMWFDALGRRLPGAVLARLRHPGHADAHHCDTGYDHSWFILTQKIIEKEFALSGSEQNPDITGKDRQPRPAAGVRQGAPAPVEAFKQHGADFVVADTSTSWSRG